MILQRNYRSNYYKNYAIIVGHNVGGHHDALTSIGDDIQYHATMYRFLDWIIELENAIAEDWQKYDAKSKKPHHPKFVIYYNKGFSGLLTYNSERVEVRMYDKLVPTYESYMIDYSEAELRRKLDSVKDIMQYYIANIGLNDYIDKSRKNDEIEYSVAYANRRLLRALYGSKSNKKLVTAGTAKNVSWRVRYNINHIPYIREIKNLNANRNIIADTTKMGKLYHNVYKLDIDSAFWSVVVLCKTYDGRFRRINNPLPCYLNQDVGYFATIKFNKYPRLKDGKKSELDWLRRYDVNVRLPIKISHVEWHDITAYYDITANDVTVIEMYQTQLVDYLTTQKELYRELHAQKSLAKANNDAVHKQILKTIGHTQHGYALCNHVFDAPDNVALTAIYDRYTHYRYTPENCILTPVDGLLMYCYTRSFLLKIIDLANNVYNYDTDSVTCDNGDDVVVAYNNWIDELYLQSRENKLQYTHDGHTIGHLEIEAYCEDYMVVRPKTYIWVEDGKLDAKTAGFARDSVVHAIERDSGKTGHDAIIWFDNLPDDYELDVGYVWEYDEYRSNVFSKKIKEALI